MIKRNNAMIKRKDYLEAKKIVEKYEEQINVKLENLASEDVNLFTVLKTRAKNAIKQYNESEDRVGDRIVFASDFARAIREEGDCSFFFRLRNVGKKTFNEVMKYVEPFL